jgi:hypothetical protein
MRGQFDEKRLSPGWPYVWAWSKRPMDRDRKGQRCRVLARGAMNSALVEFEDGTKHIASRNGIRKAR